VPCLAALFVVAFTAVSIVLANEYRTWTDATGNFHVKAKYQGVEDGKVVLIREDGHTTRIDVDKLSKADRKYVAAQISGSPSRPTEDDSAEDSAAEKEESNEPKNVTVAWSDSHEIPLPSPDLGWNVVVSTLPPLDFKPRSVAVPPRQDFWEGLNGMAVNLKARRGVIGYGWKKGGDSLTTERLTLCDLQNGCMVRMVSGKFGELAPVALHDDGRHVLMRRNEHGGGNADRLEMWSIHKKKVVRTFIWTPFGDDPGWGHDVAWAEFINSQMLALSSTGGKLAIWDLKFCQPTCHMRIDGGQHPALSPDRKWVACFSENTLRLIDVDKMKVVAFTPIAQELRDPSLAFSPSGNRIGCVAWDRILVWNAATGALEKDFVVAGIDMGGKIAFCDEDFLLVGNQYVIDLKNQVRLWQYHGAACACATAGTTFMAIAGDKNSGTLFAAKLPHRQARVMLKEALDQSDLFVFHKGTPVKLVVSGIPDPAEQAKTKEALTKKLDALHCPVSDEAKVELVAWVEGPTERKITYINMGTYTVQEYFTNLKFTYQGKNLWQTNSTNVPGVLSLGRGENIESKLREASAHPDYDLYQRAVLPEYLQEPSESHGPGWAGPSLTVGQSTITPLGMQ
jgi:WD40 repeat protein